MGLGDPEERLIGQARFFVGKRLERAYRVAELAKLDLAEAAAQVRFHYQRRAWILRCEGSKMRQRVSESPGFILKDAEKKGSLSDVIRWRIAHQGFEPGFFVWIVLEAVRLLQGFGRCFLIGLVVGQHCFIVPGRFGKFLRLVMDAGQQESSMDAKNRIRERCQHVERAPGRQIVLHEKTGIAALRPKRIFDKRSGQSLRLFWLENADKHLCLAAACVSRPFEVNR